MKPKDFLKIRDEQYKIIESSHAIINKARDDARKSDLPNNLRPATPRDIIVGAIIWYPRFSESKWLIVDEVLHPNDNWKAFCADDGCRYGLDGAFVEDDVS